MNLNVLIIIKVLNKIYREGERTYWRGAYLLVDGGYPKVGMLIDPGTKNFDYYTIMWGEWLESIRKDVECVFGALKGRFRILRNKVLILIFSYFFNHKIKLWKLYRLLIMI